MDANELVGRLTFTVPEAGEVLGIGRDAAYAAARRGEIPTLRLGRRVLVPVPLLLRMLGANREGDAVGSLERAPFGAPQAAPRPSGDLMAASTPS